jgi:hypothetical protein
MKFYDIPIGTRFVFEGIEYVKTGPVLATSTEGKQRLIRRSAILTPVTEAGNTTPAHAGESATIDRTKTLQAFDIFYRACIEAAGETPALESARQKFFDALN